MDKGRQSLLLDARKFWEYTFSKDLNCQVIHRRKLVGLDLSPRRVGVALSDDCQEFAFPLGVLNVYNHGSKILLKQAQNNTKIIQKLRDESESIAGWVVGWPLDLKGELSGRTKSTLTMIKQLQKIFGISFNQILLHDERFSTVLARADALDRPDGHLYGLDALAATRILQEYLDIAARF